MSLTMSAQGAERLRACLDHTLELLVSYDQMAAAARMQVDIEHSPLSVEVAQQLAVLAGAGFGDLPVHAELVLKQAHR